MTQARNRVRRGEHGCEQRITADELAAQAIRRDAETLVGWWLVLTHELHFRCRSGELAERLGEVRAEPSDAGRWAA